MRCSLALAEDVAEDAPGDGPLEDRQGRSIHLHGFVVLSARFRRMRRGERDEGESPCNDKNGRGELPV